MNSQHLATLPSPPDLLALARALERATPERADAFRWLCRRYDRSNCGWWRRRYRELAGAVAGEEAAS